MIDQTRSRYRFHELEMFLVEDVLAQAEALRCQRGHDVLVVVEFLHDRCQLCDEVRCNEFAQL